MNKADKLNAAAKRKPAPATAPTQKPNPEEVEQFASGGKKIENAKVTLHFSFELDSRLRRYFAGLRAPRGTLSELVEKMVSEGLDARKG
jgi:hypothetical protein